MLFNRNNKKESIFRQESLERLSSPERLDRLMQVVSPKDWLALVALNGLAIGGVIWSIVGRIPITVDGRGIFIQPRQVVEFQSSIAGQIQALNVASGQCVKKNQLLAIIYPADLQKQLQLARQQLTQLQRQAQDTLVLSKQQLETERNIITANRTNLQQRLQDISAVAPVLRDKELTAIAQQRQSLEQRFRDAQTLVPVMQTRLKQRQTLADAGGLSKDSLLQAEQEYVQTRQNLADIQVQLKQLEARNSEVERTYLEQIRSMSDVQIQLGELNAKSKRLDRENLETTNQRDKEIAAVDRDIARLEQQIKDNSQILSPQAGCILELNTTLGQVVQPGTRLGILRIGSTQESAKAIAYFAIKDGKQIQPGMSILITPDTVQRERFGGIVGKITHVSPLPVTQEGTVSVIGNPEVVRSLIGETGAIEATANLTNDSSTVTGYKWSSSQGPNSKITSGTTASVRVTIEQRAPITFVLPILREFTGIK
ncbi:NHLP bacteriocin system secretion protein [Nostoc sp. ChiSLP03a]|uniref:NHLP bacteriocin system secretion protein n=1 Tax=Nostoc sp. ChiSLP03a TaxID=3075380 RepID=UPI002AD59349|nr:NHLP bacteriocin system secretion protein [Nostoc sp. ChiSLP03a]MDZ8215210.1 NHLP bacteriocin system secretion protein [Nostoc sp. ChiSLP03a]